MIRNSILLSLCFLLISGKASALPYPVKKNIPFHFTVVIGAFAVQKNALRFARQAHEQHFDASYEFNPDRNLYYVYTLTTVNKEEAINEAKRLREETIYNDAWVYQGGMGEIEKSTKQDIDPITEKPMEQVPVKNEVPEIQTPAAVADAPNEEVPKAGPTPEGKKFLFKLYRATDNKIVTGDVDAVDIDRKRKMGTYKANEVIYLPSPKNTSHKVLLASNVFGYRKNQMEIDYTNPEGDNITTDEAEGTVIPFELIRLRKGDIVVMYNVFFFKDAAIMSPESRYEVDNLLEMMQENQKCRIRIHGHTNGSAAGKIITMGDTQNFFSLDGTKEGFGSSKGLSEARATLLRDYLISKGITKDRMEVKAWGGKRAIYSKDSEKAKENVRVEIEILQD